MIKQIILPDGGTDFKQWGINCKLSGKSVEVCYNYLDMINSVSQIDEDNFFDGYFGG